MVGFNWIFVLIAGALILGFFYSLSSVQEKTSTQKVGGEVLSNLKTVLKTSATSPKTFKTVSMPGLEIEFYCKDNISYYSIKGIATYTDLEPIFSLSRFNHPEMQVLITPWYAPFKVLNSISITSKNHAIVFINDSLGVLKGLLEELPSNLSLFIINPSNIAIPQGFDYYTIILSANSSISNEIATRSNPINLPRFGKLIVVNTTDLVNGSVTFYSPTNSNSWQLEGTSNFIGMALLLGAIFSQDKSFYDCNLEKALKVLEVTASVYKQRALMINKSISDSDTCKILYDSNDGLINLLNSLKINSHANKGKIVEIMKNLEHVNSIAIRNGCVSAY